MNLVRRLGGRDVVVAALVVSLVAAYAAAAAPLLGFAVVAAAVLASWVLRRPDLVLFVIVAALSWEAMLGFPTETLSVVKLLGLALAVSYLLGATRRHQTLRMPATLIFALLLGMVVGMSLIASPETGVGISKGIRYAFFIGFMFLVVQMVATRPIAFGLLRVFCLATVAASIYALILFLTGVVDRASGPLEDPNDFAYLTAAAVPIAAMLYAQDRGARLVWGTSIAILLGATAATFSRGAMVGLGALLIWAVFSRRLGARRLVLAGIAVAGVAILAVAFWSPLISVRVEEKNEIGERNVASRTAFWSAAEQMSYDNPVLGIGPGRFGVEAPNYVRNNPIALRDPVVHNTYLEILVENGPLALGLFLGMLVAAWSAAARAERTARGRGEEPTARLAAGVKGMLIVVTVSGLFLSEQVSPPIWLACALAGSGALAVAPTVARGRVTALVPA